MHASHKYIFERSLFKKFGYKSLKSILLVVPIILGVIFCSPSHPVIVEHYTGMEFVFVDSGSFYMGLKPDDIGPLKGAYYHQVKITKPFYIGKYEVTQGQWKKVMGNNPSHFNDLGDEYPVESINWFAANSFIDSLNKYNPGAKFRLPTEAEWEYVSRAGTTTPYSTGDNLTTDQANYYGDLPYKNYPKGLIRNHPTPVGYFDANPWGIYDMHGNVWEWCQDWFCDYPKHYVMDPLGDCKSDLKVIRGGSWYFNAECARSGRRYTHRPEDKGFSLGFRVVRVF